MVAEHSIFNSRARLGFTNFSDEERRGMPPVPQVVVSTIPESGRKSLYRASHARHARARGSHIDRPINRARDAAAIHLYPSLACECSRDVRTSRTAAPGDVGV